MIFKIKIKLLFYLEKAKKKNFAFFVIDKIRFSTYNLYQEEYKF